MNELSTNISYGVIEFHDGSETFITQTQYITLLTNFTNPNLKEFTINGNVYVKSAISKVLTLEEYYNEYPEKRIVIERRADYQDWTNQINYKAINDRIREKLKKFTVSELNAKRDKIITYIQANKKVGYGILAMRAELTERLKELQ